MVVEALPRHRTNPPTDTARSPRNSLSRSRFTKYILIKDYRIARNVTCYTPCVCRSFQVHRQAAGIPSPPVCLSASLCPSIHPSTTSAQHQQYLSSQSLHNLIGWQRNTHSLIPSRLVSSSSSSPTHKHIVRVGAVVDECNTNSSGRQATRETQRVVVVVSDSGAPGQAEPKQ